MLSGLLVVIFAVTAYFHDFEAGAGISFRDYTRVCKNIRGDDLTSCVRNYGGANPLGEVFIRTHPADNAEFYISHKSSVVEDNDNYDPEPPIEIGARYFWKIK